MNKPTLQAFAGGLIFATLVLGGVYIISEEKPLEEPIIDAETVDTFLEANNYVKVSESEYVKLKEASNELLSLKEQLQSGQNEAKPQSEEVVDDNTTSNNTPKPKQDEASPEPITYVLTINQGMTSTAVANTLQKNGIIKNAKDFDTFLVNNGYNRLIQVNTYTVTSNMTYDQLAGIITGN
ncbi:hypothetical protein EJF36_13725 [Bacillus sp. HMF5848]|uniref:hypothetical protein n=1 Tax=Bacillus sp. HMF5848 TaxID=2495421 RepID=UPI000F7A8915|nr:hypothetical protein [Bacillus sp. HMF5848]RSK27850.1 hypothetical protein EJF36_13725 [Bacillus sp. HMF5848]